MADGDTADAHGRVWMVSRSTIGVRLVSDSMERLCGRPGCSDRASVAYGMRAEDLVFWLDVLPDDDGGVGGVLCRRHADSMIVPRGWTLDDLRDPSCICFVRPIRLARVRTHRQSPVRSTDATGEQLRLTDEMLDGDSRPIHRPIHRLGGDGFRWPCRGDRRSRVHRRSRGRRRPGTLDAQLRRGRRSRRSALGTESPVVESVPNGRSTGRMTGLPRCTPSSYRPR